MNMIDVMKRLAELDSQKSNVVKEAKRDPDTTPSEWDDEKEETSAKKAKKPDAEEKGKSAKPWEKKGVEEGVTMEQMSMDSLRLLAGMTNKLKEHGIETVNPFGKKTLKECGPMGMSAPSAPANVSVTAGSGDELGSLLKTIMSLAGVKPVTPDDMPVDHGASAPMPPQMGGEPDMKALIDVVTDEPESELDTMNDIEDGEIEDDEEEIEGYDNSPKPAMKQDGVRQFGDVDNNFQNSQVGRNVKQTTAESLYADYQKFMTEAKTGSQGYKELNPEPKKPGIGSKIKAGVKKVAKAITGPNDDELLTKLEKETGGKRPSRK